MDFTELDIKRSYISYGDDNIANSLIKPALKCAKCYKRSVGFFSSGVFKLIMDGIITLARNKGTIQLITSPKLNDQDIEAINLGYANRENILNVSAAEEFETEIQDFENIELQLLVELIANGTLDIKIAITSSIGDYHDKLGILEDLNGNVIVFYGSANETFNGYQNNYEKIRVVKSWISGELESVLDEQKEFDSLWKNNNPFVQVFSFKESAQKKILEVLKNRESAKANACNIKLRDYQENAIQAWVDNNYQGFFVMATGTGKTWTAIYSAKQLIKSHPSIIVICAPYKHLVRQWAEDVERAFPESKIILISSENPKWESQMNEEIIRHKYDESIQIIAISTISSFNQERFSQTIEKDKGSKLLIVDEAHRFTKRPESLHTQYLYMLGLSATPYTGRSKEKGDELMAFFGGRVFNLPIENALGKYLVNYNYYPIFVNATEDDETQFNYYSARMAACFTNGVLVDIDGLIKAKRSRLRVISMAQEKIERINYIVDQINESDHFVVYCGDGRLFDNDRQQELRHIQYIKKVLDQHGYKPSQFTATENMDKRIDLVDAFNKGEISALAAIRCLDEGINIPSIKGALILSSNDDYREFVQRRGRILRQYEGKNYANIYDVIVLPSSNTPGMAIIEFRRFLEYARLALNQKELLKQLNGFLEEYSLTIDKISIIEEDMEEDQIDE